MRISDWSSDWCSSDLIGFAPIFVSWAITDDERRAEARADEQVGVAAKGDGEREGAAQLRQHRLHRVGGRSAGLDLFGDEMRDDFCIGVALEAPAAPGESLAQRERQRSSLNSTT